MAKYTEKTNLSQKAVKQNNIPSGTAYSQSLRRIRRNIYRQAALALLTVILTVVILFAMTSAWYTNIVQTSGLVFEAEAWGFDGTITVNEDPILAAPGDDGIVHLTVENKSDSISAISVNVSKAGMVEEMQKRLFFYVDTRMNRNDETMERVYLNKYEGYTYNVFSNGTLTLTEQVSNGPAIKWEWVYDVLGYYVLAQPQKIEAEDGTVTTKMTIKEYLRPIEYDYDEATTVISADGEEISVKLDTVDGTTDPEVFLWQQSHKDGYEGVIDPQNKLSNNFYVVDVDENGFGVYAYLCNYSEIELASDYDTMLGQLAYQKAKGVPLTDAEKELLSHSVKLTLSAQTNESAAVNVSTLSAMQEAVALGISDVVQLSSNITIPEGETLVIPPDTNVMLDLNSYTITNVSETAIVAAPGSALTMVNGTLEGPGDSTKTYGIYATGAEVVMSDVAINDFRYGIYMGDNENDNELDSRVYMVDCTIDAESYAVFISGNGLLSEQKSQLIIEDSKLSSDGIVITGNGDTNGNGRWGTDIQIINSTITGTVDEETGVRGAGIYQPQKNSALKIYNSTVDGYNGIAIKGGTVDIVDSTIKGTGDYTEPSFSGSGFTDTGDAVYIETNYGYEVLLKISGNSVLTHTAADSKSLRVYLEQATNVLVEIESGTFDEEQLEDHIAEGSVQTQADGKTVVAIDTAATE